MNTDRLPLDVDFTVAMVMYASQQGCKWDDLDEFCDYAAMFCGGKELPQIRARLVHCPFLRTWGNSK
jgi:hypothetical protein